MPVIAFAQADPLETAHHGGLFLPPAAPMVLTRTLRRPLPDGKQIVTRRSYEVRIIPDGEGFRVEGDLVDVAVNAPEKLRALAELERTRSDKGMFPMRLDVNGMLLRGGDPRSDKAVEEAIKRVSQKLGTLKLAAFDRRQAQAFVDQFRQRKALSQWPVDLFRPNPGQYRKIRTIPLSNGARGQVTVDTEATTAQPAGLLSTFTRTITTDLDGDSRVTYETWELVEAAKSNIDRARQLPSPDR